MREKRFLIIIIISIIMIILGVIVYFIFNNTNNTNNANNNKYNEVVEKEVCLDNLCVEKVEINFNNNSEMINFQIKNKGEMPIQNGYFKIVFNNNKSYITRHGTIEPNNTEGVEIELYNEKPFSINNYELQYLSDEELQMINSN